MIRHDNDRPPVQHQPETDNWWIRASALGGCIKSLAAGGRGLEPAPTPEWMQEKYNEGHANEPVIAQMAMDKMITARWANEAGDVDGQTAMVLTFHDDDAVIHVEGHVDDLVWYKGQRVGEASPAERPTVPDAINEYKALGPSYVNAVKGLGDNPNPARVLEVLPATYKWSLSVYYWGFIEKFGEARPVHLHIGVKDDQGVVQELLPVVVISGSHLFTKSGIGARAWAIVNAARADGDLPECDVQQYPCPFYLLHDDDEVPTVDGDEGENLRHLIFLRDHAQRERDLWDLEYKKHNVAIGEALDGRKSVRVQERDVDGLTTVTWVKQEVKERTQVVKAHTREFPKITRPKTKTTEKAETA